MKIAERWFVWAGMVLLGGVALAGLAVAVFGVGIVIHQCGRARAIGWMFAALNTVEPPIVDRSMCALFEREQPWFEQRLAGIDATVRKRLAALSARLGDADWLDGDFSAGDLLMVSVLLRLRPSSLLDEYQNLKAYVARGEARPAYKRAFAAQLAVFAAASAADEGSKRAQGKPG